MRIIKAIVWGEPQQTFEPMGPFSMRRPGYHFPPDNQIIDPNDDVLAEASMLAGNQVVRVELKRSNGGLIFQAYVPAHEFDPHAFALEFSPSHQLGDEQ